MINKGIDISSGEIKLVWSLAIGMIIFPVYSEFLSYVAVFYFLIQS